MRLRSLWSWGYSKSSWAGHCATCSCRPCFGQEVGLDDLQWFHPPSVGLWLWTGTLRGAPAALDRGPVATWISFLAMPLMKLEFVQLCFITLYQLIKSNYNRKHWEWLREGTRMCNSSSLLEMHNEEQVYLNFSLALDCLSCPQHISKFYAFFLHKLSVNDVRKRCFVFFWWQPVV